MYIFITAGSKSFSVKSNKEVLLKIFLLSILFPVCVCVCVCVCGSQQSPIAFHMSFLKCKHLRQYTVAILGQIQYLDLQALLLFTCFLR